MQKPLAGLHAAILVANGFNEIEMTIFQRALLEVGAHPKIISVESSLAHGWQNNGWGHYHPVEKHLSDALAADYDMLIVASGHRGHEKLKQTAHTRRFIGGFMMAYKPVLALGDAVVMMAELGLLNGAMVATPQDKAAAVTAAGAVASEMPQVIHNNLMSMTTIENSKEESIAAFMAFIQGSMEESAEETQAA